MKVCVLADKLNVRRGGSNFSLDLIARSLTERGHEVTVLTVHFAHENVLPADYPYDVVEAPLDTTTRVGDARGVLDILNENESAFDVYHVFNPALHPIAGYYRLRGGATPVVGRLNSFDVFCTNHALMDGKCHERCTVPRKFAHASGSTSERVLGAPKYVFDTYALPRLLNRIDRLFALSPAVADIYRGIGVEEERLALVPSGYDPSFGGGRSRTVESTFDRTVLYVGTLNPHKGVDVLIDAASALPIDVGIEIVGEGPERDGLEAQAERLGIDDVVRFLGWVDHEELPAYYRNATVFVHPGLWPEPFNRTLLEAMQCDCPLVVSDVGGPPWVVEDCGLTFERGNPTSLAEALNELLENESLRRACSDRCRGRLETFAPERQISLIEEHYRRVVER